MTTVCHLSIRKIIDRMDFEKALRRAWFSHARSVLTQARVASGQGVSPRLEKAKTSLQARDRQPGSDIITPRSNSGALE